MLSLPCPWPAQVARSQRRQQRSTGLPLLVTGQSFVCKLWGLGSAAGVVAAAAKRPHVYQLTSELLGSSRRPDVYGSRSGTFGTDVNPQQQHLGQNHRRPYPLLKLYEPHTCFQMPGCMTMTRGNHERQLYTKSVLLNITGCVPDSVVC